MDRKASQEQLATPLTGAEFWAGSQGGDDVKLTAAQVLSYILGSGNIVGGENITLTFNPAASTLTITGATQSGTGGTIPAQYLDYAVVLPSQVSANQRVCSFKIQSNVTIADWSNSTSHVDGSTVTAAHVFAIHVFQADFQTLVATLGTLTWVPNQAYGTFAFDSSIVAPYSIPAGSIIDVRSDTTQPTFAYCGFTLSFKVAS